VGKDSAVFNIFVTLVLLINFIIYKRIFYTIYFRYN